MTSYKFSWVVLHCWFLSLLLFKAHGEGSGISVNFLDSPSKTSRLNSTRFSFDVWVDGKKVSLGENSPHCTGSSITCQLDNGITTDCGGKVVSYTGLQEGNHTFAVCNISSPAVRCSNYSWIVDTVPPTASITSPSSFTTDRNVSVNISFTEPCTGEDGKDGFKCSSENACSLLVSGDGTVVPSSLVNLVPRRKYTLLVNLSSYGNVTLEIDNISCTDTAGNKFIRSENSTFNISFDSRRPTVKFFPTHTSTWQSPIPILIEFSKPVLGLKRSSINVSGGHLLSFGKINSTAYNITIQADDEAVSVTVPENVTEDVYGNRNQASDLKLERPTGHILPRVLSTFVTSTFGIACLGHGMLAVSSACHACAGANLRAHSSTMSGPATNLLLSLGHIQLIALSGGLTHNLPYQYNEYAKAFRWSILQFNLPWEKKNVSDVQGKANSDKNSIDYCLKEENVTQKRVKPLKYAEEPDSDWGESTLLGKINKRYNPSSDVQEMKDGWPMFCRSVFWLAVIGSTLILLHALLILIIKIRWPQTGRDYGELVFPRFEISLIIAALPSLSKASAGLIRETKGSGDIVGGVLLGVVGLILVSFFIFLFVGATLGMLLLYHEKSDIHNEALEQPKLKLYQRIAHKTLGPHLKGEWTGKNQSNQVYVKIFGPLFEDLRGLHNHMLPQGNPQIHGDDETRDAEAPGSNPSISKQGGRTISSNNEMKDLEAEGNPQNPGDDETHDAEAPGGNPSISKHGDGTNSSNNKIEDLAQGNPQSHGDDKTHDAEAPGDNPSNSKHGDRTIYSKDEMKDLDAQGNPLNLDDDETQDAEAPAASNSKHGDRTISFNDEMEDVEAPGSNSHKSDDVVVTSVDKTGDARAPGTKANPRSNGDEISASADKKVDARTPGANVQKNNVDDKREGARGLGGNPENRHSDPSITKNASSIEKPFSILRTYYTLFGTVRLVILGILGGAFTADDKPTKSPAIFMLCITCFLLLFLVYLKPFISKRGLVVEIIAIVREVGVFTLLLIWLKNPSEKEKDEFEKLEEENLDKCMIIISLIGDLAEMINKYYDLYRKIKKFDHAGNESFVGGLQRAFFGFFSFCLPRKTMGKWGDNFSETEPGKEGIAENASFADRNGSSTTTYEPGVKQPSEPTKSKSFSGLSKQGSRDEPGMKQPSEPTKSKSFPSLSNQASRGPNDPSSTSGNASAPPPSELGRY